VRRLTAAYATHRRADDVEGVAVAKKAGADGQGTEPVKGKQRARLSQEDVPAYSLDQALRVPQAIADGYAYKPTRPLNVAGVMKMSPSSSHFRMITGAAVAYGLTAGAAQAPEIGITPLGMRIVRPTSEGEDLTAKREALLRPKVVGEFLRDYDGAALPSETIAKNVLQEKGVPSDRLDDVLTLILEGAEAVGFLKVISGKRYVDLATPAGQPEKAPAGDPSPPLIPPPLKPLVTPPPDPTVTVGAGVHVNIEIHIAADATSETIEDIFKNMRRYVLSDDGAADNDTSSAD
jgi:hypothetical protein